MNEAETDVPTPKRAARTALPEGWWLATTWSGDRVHFMNPHTPGRLALCGWPMAVRVEEWNGYDDMPECRRCLARFDGRADGDRGSKGHD